VPVPAIELDQFNLPEKHKQFMPTGIAQESCINEYVRQASELTRKWATFDKYDRIGHLAGAAAAQINKFSVAWPKWNIEKLDNANGQFQFRIWEVKLSEAKWKLAAPKEAEMQVRFKKGISKLADTMYHEYRHCEQWYRMARFLASTGKSPAEISQMMGIPINIAQASLKAPRLNTEELSEGEAWYEGVYGRPVAPKSGVATATAVGNFNQRDLILTAKLRPTTGQSVSGKSEKSNVQADELAAISARRQMSSYLQYRNLLLEEDDAHAVGTAVQKKFYLAEGLSGEPEAPKHAGVRPSENVTNV
jgi:hypothetical protein